MDEEGEEEEEKKEDEEREEEKKEKEVEEGEEEKERAGKYIESMRFCRSFTLPFKDSTVFLRIGA